MKNPEIRFGQIFHRKSSAIFYIGSYARFLNPKARIDYKGHEMTIDRPAVYHLDPDPPKTIC